MDCNYIVRLLDNRLISLYYKPQMRIAMRIYESGRWQAEKEILSNVRPDFTVNFSNNGGINIFCQNADGSIALVNYNNGEINTRTILENKSESVHTLLLHSLSNGPAMSLIYNIPGEGQFNKLIRQNLSESGVWGKPAEIDTFSPLPGSVFEVQHITPEHALIFYRSERNIAGYKEVTADRLGEFNAIQRQTENILSYSFLTDEQSVHTLYATQTLFSFRLIYRKKENAAFDDPIVLWEGQRLGSCLLLKSNNELIAFFQADGNLYAAKSQNNGVSFKRPELYRFKFCKNPAKAYYITKSPIGSLSHVCRDVFVDSQCPWDVQILPEINEDFYPYTELSIQSESLNEEPANVNTQQLEMMAEKINALTEENQNNKAEILRLKQNSNDTELKYVSKVAELSDIIQKYSAENESLKIRIKALEEDLAISNDGLK